MNLTQLKYFQAVINYGTLSKAAEMLNISQPSISSAIAALENEYGVKLFIRQHQGMTPTPEGLTLASLSETLLDQSTQINKIMENLGSSKQSLRIGISPILGSLILPRILPLIERESRNEMLIVEDDAGSLMRQLDDRSLDLAIIPHIKKNDESFVSVPIGQLETYCAVSKDHKLAQKSSIHIDDIVLEKLVVYRKNSCQTQLLFQAFDRIGAEPNVLITTTQVSTLTGIVEKNIAVGFIFKDLPCSESIKTIPISPPMFVDVSLIYKKNIYITEVMKEFIGYVRKAKHIG